MNLDIVRDIIIVGVFFLIVPGLFILGVLAGRSNRRLTGQEIINLTHSAPGQTPQQGNS